MGILDLLKKKGQPGALNKQEGEVKFYVDDEKSDEINNVYVDMSMHIEDKCMYGENLSLLSVPERNVFVVYEFFNETYNGGLEKFLLDGSGSHYSYLKVALAEIKAMEVLDIYADVFAVLPNDLPIDEDERDRVLYKILNDKLIKKIQKCNLKFYGIPEMYLQSLVYNYIMSNKESFDFEES